MEAAKAFLILVCLPGTLIAGPVKYSWRNSDEGRSQCTTTCTDTTKFGYEAGKTYRYAYEVTGVSNFQGASDQSATVFASAHAHIHVVSKCEMALTLSDVVFKTSDPDSSDLRDVGDYQYTSNLEENPLFFSFQDGRVEELCITSNDDNAEILNFKRGILSAFQNSMSQHHMDQSLREIDVSGNCPTDYTVSQKGWKSIEILKSKDLLGCIDRQHFTSSLHATPLRLPNAIMSLPILKGDVKCSLKITTEKILSSVSCTESLVFRPFSKRKSGAKTETVQTLKYVDEKSSSSWIKGPFPRRTSLLFEHSHNGDTSVEEIWAVRDKLEQLCKSSQHGITKEVPGLFADMVYIMKELQYDALNDLWSGVNSGLISSDNKQKARDFILDSLPMVGTEASVRIMVDLLLSDNGVTGIKASLWLKSFTFLHHPNKEMIANSFGRLLLSEKLRMDSLLPVSSAIHNYCENKVDCESQKEVVDIVSIMDDILGRDCKASDENLILMTLRAAGNLGFSDSLVSTLENCLEMSGNSLDIRVSAIQAFKGITCKAKRDSLMDMFQNKGEDSELRINAYLGLMMCPSQAILGKVKMTLESEEIDQVGSFVWTHLTNLAESSSPQKQDLKAILQDETLKKEFNMDKRKYSRNYEMSYFSERFGLGGMVESNLIWSSSSFLPRSMMMNLTVEVLGHSMNLFEVGGRAQGLQQMLHEYIASKLDSDKEGKNPSRCVNKRKMDAMKDKHEVKEEDFTASMYLRMFGNEIDYKHFTMKDLIALRNKMNSRNIVAALAKGDDISFTHSAMFLDSTVTVPTIAGMAFHLSINGTASIQLKASGKMDLRRMSMKRMEINFDLRPSGAVQIGGEMTLNAGPMKSGIKMATTLHSSTAFTGSLDLSNGQVLTVTADTPGEKMELLDVQSEFFIVHTNAVRPQRLLADKAGVQQKGCANKMWLQGLGYELCGDVSYVNASMIQDAPYFPMTGPLSGSVVLYKKDAPQGLKLMAENIQNEVKSLGRFSVDTPGSKVDRALGFSYFVDTKDHSIEIEAKSPWKKVLVKGSYDTSAKTHKVSGSLIMDGKTYDMTFNLDRDEKSKKVIWTPNLQISRPKDSKLLAMVPSKIQMTGTISLAKQLDEVSTDIDILTDFTPVPIKIQTNYVNKMTQKTLSGALILNKKDIYTATFQVMETYAGKNTYPSKIKPSILISAPKWRIFLLSGNIDYKRDKMMKSNMQVTMEKTLTDPIVVSCKITKSKTKFKGNGKLTSQFGTIKSKGFIDVPAMGQGKKKGPLMSSKIVTSYNLPVVKDRSLRKNLVVFSSKIHDRSSKTLTKYDADLIFESRNYQKASFVASAGVTHKETFTKSVVTFKSGPKSKNLKDKSRQLKMEAYLNHKLAKKDVEIKYDVQVLYPLKAIEWQINGKHEHHLKQQIQLETYNSFIFAKGKSSELRLKVDSNSKKSVDYTGLFEFNYPSFKLGEETYKGSSYKIVSTVQQSPKKELVHSIEMNINKDIVHSMLTKIEFLKSEQYKFRSQINIGGDDKMKITVKNSHVNKAREASLKLERDGKTYQADTEVTINDQDFSINWDITLPVRQVQWSLSGVKTKGGYQTKFRALPEANIDATKKIEADVIFDSLRDSKKAKFEVELSLKTPIKDYRVFTLKRLMEIDSKEIKDESKVIWREAESEWSYDVWMLRPASPKRFQMDFQIVTPMEKFRIGRTEIRHQFDGSNYLSTSVKSKYNENDVSMDVLMSHRKNKIQNRLETRFEVNVWGAKRDEVTLKMGNFHEDLSFNPLSPGWPKRLKFLVSHNNNGMIFDTDVMVIRNNVDSKITHHATYSRVGKMVNLKSHLDVVLDDLMLDPLRVELTHANSLTNLNSTISATWGEDQKVNLDIGSTFLKHDQTLFIHYSGTTETVRDWIYKQHHNTLNGWSGSSFSQMNKDIRTQSSTKYKFTKTELSYEMYSPTSKSIVKAEYERYPYTVYMKYSYLNKVKWEDIVFDGSVIKNDENDWTSDMRLVTTFDAARNIDVKGNLKDTGNNKWMLDGAISFDVRKNIKLKSVVDIDKWSQIDVDIQSPWKDVSLNVNNKKQRRGFKTDVTLRYDKDEIVGKFNGKFKFPEKNVVSVDLSTPYDVLRSLNVKTNLNKLDNKWTGGVNVKTSNDRLKFFKMDFSQELGKESFENAIDITSSAFDRVASGFKINWSEDFFFNTTLIAPEIGRTMIGIELLPSTKSWFDFHERIFGEVMGYELDMNYGLKHTDENTKFWLTFDYPGADKGYIKTSLHRYGKSFLDFDVGGDLQIGKNRAPYNASLQFSYIEGKTVLGATLKNSPLLNNIYAFSFLLKNEMSKSGQARTVFGEIGTDYMLDLSGMDRMYDSKYVNKHHFKYLFDGKGHSSGYELSAEWSDEGEEFKLKSNYDDDEITVEGTHTTPGASDTGEDILDAYVTTPFDNFNDLEAHFSMAAQKRGQYTGKWLVEYMDGQEADLTYDVKKTGKKVVASGVLTLPLKGYERNTLNYVQVVKKDKISVDAEAVTGQGEQLKANLEITDKEEFILSVTGPIKEFQTLKIAGKYNEEEQRLNGDIQLLLTLHPRVVFLEYDIHIKEDPVIMTFKLRSPYEHLKKADLTINHSGKTWDKMSTLSTLTSESLGKVTLNTKWVYLSPTSMEGQLVFTSSLEKLENLRLSYKTNPKEKNNVGYQIEMGWDVDQEITIQSSWREDESGPYKMTTTFDMTTPFEEVKVLNVKFSELKGHQRAVFSTFVRHNEHTYLDSDLSYSSDDKKHIGSLDMRKPKPMSVDVEGEFDVKTFDGKVILNWDKRSPEKKFEFNIHLSDKSEKENIDTSFAFKVVHPVRIMAVEYLLRKADNEMQSSGLITWDESKGNTFSYDVGYTDRSSMYSKMYDGHVKVGVPQRSVKLLGSLSDTGSSRSIMGTALWDADRDETKKVTLSTTHEYSERMERINMNVNLPSINKQLNVKVSLKKGYGSAILDSKAEISYSPDRRKTILITNKVFNTIKDKASSGLYNYTMETRFKHSVTDIDLQWLSHVGKGEDTVTAGNQFTYLTLNKEQKVFDWYFEHERNGMSTSLRITTPLKTVKIYAANLSELDIPAGSLSFYEDGKQTLELRGSMPLSKRFHVSFMYDIDDPDKRLVVEGQLVGDDVFEMSLTNDDNDVLAMMNVKMNSSHVIHNRIIWNPAMPADFKKFMGTKVTAFSYALKKVWDEAVKNVGNEVKAKYLRVSQELRDEMGQLFSLITKEMELFNVQLETLSRTIRRIYNRNDLSIRDIGQQVDDGLRELLMSIQNLVKNYRAYYNKVSQSTNNWINGLKNYPISLMYGKTISEFVETMKEVRLVLEKTLQEVVMEMSKLSKVSFKKYVEMTRFMERKMDSYLQSQQKLVVFRQMAAERERLARMGADYNSKELEKFDMLSMRSQQLLDDTFHDLMTRDEFRYLHAMGTEIYQQMKYYSAEEGVSAAVSRLIDLSKNLIMMEMARVKDSLVDFKKTRITFYNPQQGEIQFELHVPFEMKSLSEPPEVQIGKYIKDSYKWIEGRIPSTNSSVWDLYYGYVPSLKPSDWVPPFEATGYVIGSQHIMTFDKVHKDFLSSCSHVLVRDMLNNSFSVILNYDKKPKLNGVKSLCFHIGKSLALEVTKDYRLTVNNKEVEMPFVNDVISVERRGDTMVLRYINGLEVISNPSLDIYKVTLSGWFHGRTAGLLGVYDNEKKNDEAMLDRAHEVEVNRKYCGSKNVAESPDSSQDVNGICDEMFKDTGSKFSPCFKQVDPSAFLGLCQMYMSKMNEAEAIYKATSQYRSVCGDHGVFMGPLEEYIPCNNEREFMVEGTDPLYQSADVLFVMEDAECNKWASSSVTNIVTEMNKALTQAGMKNNRFGLTGFKGQDATVRTIHGNHFGKPNMFLKAVETLGLGKLEGQSDLVTAVRTAMDYPFRPGVAKVLVVAPCSKCQVGFLERNLDSALKSGGFRVHILQQQEVSILGNDYRDIMPNSIYHMDQISPKDYCSTMAGTTNGSVFDTTHLTKSKGKIQRDFIKSLAKKVGWNTKLPACQLCQCDTYSERLQCQLCNSWSYMNYLPKSPVSLDGFVGRLHDLQYDVKSSLSEII